MKVMLINPPISSPFMPSLSLPTLTGYLRESGIEVRQVDASLEAFHYYLTPGRLLPLLPPDPGTLIQELINRRGAEFVNGFFKGIHFDIDTLDDKRIRRITDAVREVWDEEGFRVNKETFGPRFVEINEALILSSLSRYPYILTTAVCGFGVFFMFPMDGERNPFLGFYRGDRPIYASDPFCGYYREIMIPRIKEYQPDLIGISYNYSQQFFHGLAMTREIREQGLEIPIVMGGSDFTHYSKTLSGKAAEAVTGVSFSLDRAFRGIKPVSFSPLNITGTYLASGANFAIEGEGERPLLELCRRLEAGENWTDIPGLVYYKKETGTIVFNKPTPPLPAEELPIIDFDGLPMGKYLSPVPVAPVYISRGCYWDKCAFCNLSTTLENRFREIKLEKIMQTLAILKEKYHIRVIQFADEGMSPATLKAVSREVLKRDFDMVLTTMVRFDRKLLDTIELASAAGFKLLSYGLESGNPRIVKLMNKGYTHDNARAIIDECQRRGVKVQVFTMYGFPTETREEAQDTIRFLEENKDKIDLILTSVWYLTPGSPIEKNLDDYGLAPAPEQEVSAWNQGSFIRKQGMSREEAVKIQSQVLNHPHLKDKVVTERVLTESYYMRKLIGLLASFVNQE